MSQATIDPGARTRAASLSGWPQRLAHTVVVVAGWALFVWGWLEVLGRPWDSEALSWLIVGSLVVLPTITIAWILHNLGIHRRKGARTGVPRIDESYPRDWNGREVVADWPALAHARLITVELDGERKVYRMAKEGATAHGLHNGGNGGAPTRTLTRSAG